MGCVSYGRKKDKGVVLSSNRIYWEYITVILTFSTCFYPPLLFLGGKAMSTEKVTMNIKQQLNPKFLVWLGKTPSMLEQEHVADIMLRGIKGSKRGGSKVKSQSCWPRSPLWGALSTVNSCHGVWGSISKSTWRSAAYASLRIRKETRVVTGRIMAALLRQYLCLQRQKHPTGPGWQEHRRNGTIFLFLLILRHVIFFYFPRAQEENQGESFWRRWSH